MYYAILRLFQNSFWKVLHLASPPHHQHSLLYIFQFQRLVVEVIGNRLCLFLLNDQEIIYFYFIYFYTPPQILPACLLIYAFSTLLNNQTGAADNTRGNGQGKVTNNSRTTLAGPISAARNTVNGTQATPMNSEARRPSDATPVSSSYAGSSYGGARIPLLRNSYATSSFIAPGLSNQAQPGGQGPV